MTQSAIFALSNGIMNLRTNQFIKMDEKMVPKINCGWPYVQQLADKYHFAVHEMFTKIFPVPGDRIFVINQFRQLLIPDVLRQTNTKNPIIISLVDGRNGGASGKSTVLKVMEQVFGNYAYIEQDTIDHSLDALKDASHLKLVCCDDFCRPKELYNFQKRLRFSNYHMGLVTLCKKRYFHIKLNTSLLEMEQMLQNITIVEMRSKFVDQNSPKLQRMHTFVRQTNYCPPEWNSAILDYLMSHRDITYGDGYKAALFPVSMQLSREKFLRPIATQANYKRWLMTNLEQNVTEPNEWVTLNQLRRHMKQHCNFRVHSKHKFKVLIFKCLRECKIAYVHKTIVYAHKKCTRIVLEKCKLK